MNAMKHTFMHCIKWQPEHFLCKKTDSLAYRFYIMDCSKLCSALCTDKI